MFEISIVGWLAREGRDEIERSSLAQLELRYGDRALTLLEDRLAHTNRRFANLSAYDLALWLATNWWRLCWEPDKPGTVDWQMAHSMATIGGGYVWPTLTIRSDGERLFIQAQPSEDKTWQPIRYLESLVADIRLADFQQEVDDFIENVLRRLDSLQLHETGLHRLIAELSAERRDGELSRIRKLEALAGFDAGEAPNQLIDGLVASSKVDGQSAVAEVAAEFGSASPDVLQQIGAAIDTGGVVLQSAGVLELAKRQGTLQGAPWERGEAAAQQARAIFGFNGGAISDQDLTAIVGANASLMAPPNTLNVPMAAARWSSRERQTWSVVLRSRFPEGRRFDLSRLIADTLLSPHDDLLMPATRAKTSRQKFQRAFGHEFLCPTDALMDMLDHSVPDGEAIEQAARHFRVSPLLVQSKLANLGILPKFEAPNEVTG